MMKTINFSKFFRDEYNYYQNNSGRSIREEDIHTILVQTCSITPKRIICFQSCANNKHYTYLQHKWFRRGYTYRGKRY